MFKRLKNSQNGIRTFMTNTFLWRKHYDSLGLTQKATQNDIKSAYYKLSMMFHPDKNKDFEAAQRFRDITEAYEILGNINLKKLYDKGLIGNELSAKMAADPNRSHWKAPIQPTVDDLDPKMKFYRSRDFRDKIPTMDGRTQIYDFDTWNRMHYDDLIKKKSKAKMRKDYTAYVLSSDSSNRKGNENLIAVLLICGVFLFVVIYSISVDMDRIIKFNNPKPLNHLESIKDEK